MLHRFFKWLNKPKLTILMQQTCQHDLVSNMMQLPNGLILSGGTVKTANNFVNLELYDPIKKTKVSSRKLESKDYPRFLCMSKEWVLIKCDFSDYQYVVSSSTLQSDEKLEAKLKLQKLDINNGAYLGEQKFATLNQQSDRNTYVIMAHDLSTMKFNQPASATLTLPKEASHGHMLGFQALSNGLFACQVKGHNSSCFQILLFKREPGPAIQFTQIQTLHPKTQPSGDSAASGKFVGLSDGRILTYHSSGNHFQVWLDDGKCVDEWSWRKDVTCDDKTFEQGFSAHNVVPLPDGEHLLIQVFDKTLFLVNIKTRVAQPVDFSELGLEPWEIMVLANGQVAVRMTHQHKITHLVCIDLKEMMSYRQGVTDQLSSVGLSSRDINRLVTSYISDTSPWVVAEVKKPGKR